MVFGILNPSDGTEHVGATNLLSVDNPDAADYDPRLQRGTGKNATTVLIPQPSNDPNDPLRWPLWQRDLIFLMYQFCTVLTVGGIGPLLSASAAVLAEEFNVTFTDVTLLTGYNTCAVGAAGILISALSRKYGKRPGFLFSMTCAFIGSIWGGFALSYNSLLGARIVQGLGVSMFESVIFAVVGDLYYVHERGVRVALVTVSISGLANLPTVISGVQTTNLGWRWLFWILGIFLGVGLVLVCLFGWESAFNRAETSTNLDLLPGEDSKETTSVKEIDDSEANQAGSTRQRKSFLRRLSPFSGSYSDMPLWEMVTKPFLVLRHPAVIWATILLAVTTAWYVVVSFIIAQVFASPPYLLTAAEIGYMSAGPTVGATLASLANGLISDPIARALARKNRGMYEPEYRLVLVLPMLVTAVLGWFLFGNLIAAGESATVIAVVWALPSASMQFCLGAIGTYMVDAYPSISTEVFIIGMVVKNFLFFGLSFGVNRWLDAWGPAKMFDTVGGIQLALCLLSGLVWVFGKRWRARFYASKGLK